MSKHEDDVLALLRDILLKVNPPMNGWDKWSNYVLAEIGRINEGQEEIKKNCSVQCGRMEKQLITLTVRTSWVAGIWGALSGLAVAIGAVLLHLFGSHTGGGK